MAEVGVLLVGWAWGPFCGYCIKWFRQTEVGMEMGTGMKKTEGASKWLSGLET